MTQFQENTESLRKQLEAGDIAEICKRAGCVANSLYSAWRRKEASELTNTERKAYDAFVAFVSKRVKEKENIAARAAELAGTLK